ncbi:hypothetical protein ES332_A01G120600v1 [Gossypium tomentosum]|uniref:Uncharacterized protein n=1 Tax=Gossypium tomentosum TaxID=34277 RepID=A0A5D2RRR6_GOSTO|nr:hypothetical protein ES332_A01G120600v1 [Gossypium tomentosum]
MLLIGPLCYTMDSACLRIQTVEHEIFYYMLTFSWKLRMICNVALLLCEEHKRIWYSSHQYELWL